MVQQSEFHFLSQICPRARFQASLPLQLRDVPQWSNRQGVPGPPLPRSVAASQNLLLFRSNLHLNDPSNLWLIAGPAPLAKAINQDNYVEHHNFEVEEMIKNDGIAGMFLDFEANSLTALQREQLLQLAQAEAAAKGVPFDEENFIERVDQVNRSLVERRRQELLVEDQEMIHPKNVFVASLYEHGEGKAHTLLGEVVESANDEMAIENLYEMQSTNQYSIHELGRLRFWHHPFPHTSLLPKHRFFHGLAVYQDMAYQRWNLGNTRRFALIIGGMVGLAALANVENVCEIIFFSSLGVDQLIVPLIAGAHCCH